MTTTINSRAFHDNLYGIMERTAKYNETVSITSETGNVVLMSEEDYRGLMETLYIESIPNLKEDILAAKNAPEEDVPESEVIW